MQPAGAMTKPMRSCIRLTVVLMAASLAKLGKEASLLGFKGSIEAAMTASAGTKWTDEDRETISNMTSEQQSQIQAAIDSYRTGANRNHHSEQ
ncbi:hypothetical protein [Vibrio parahaemolyticus]|uniref:hypothetical protein n=1 Tax=Vibrio parahaemolyticus TaxID=670 RepID=UPI0023581029|nr:hypothetical protein [Vibrio parahaemolyticus]